MLCFEGFQTTKYMSAVRKQPTYCAYIIYI